VLPPEQFVNHDQIVREHYLNLSAGTSVSLSDSVDVFAAFMKQKAGRNTHEVSRAISIGMSWAFKRQREPDDIAAAAAPTGRAVESLDRQRGDTQAAAATEQTPARRSLLRCLCQKAGG
jgi:hypothetical protein